MIQKKIMANINSKVIHGIRNKRPSYCIVEYSIQMQQVLM